MIFSELYSAYYNTVAAILKVAVTHPISKEEMEDIVKQYAFSESVCNIPDALFEERWQLLKKDGTTPLKQTPKMPLTNMQKSWLKAISLDPRIQLFGDHLFDFPDIEPLFVPEDIVVFDRYLDGDNYTDQTYIRHFRIILDAIKNEIPLIVTQKNREGKSVDRLIVPEYLEYSEKDDKFRLIGAGSHFGNTINLGRIIHCQTCDKTYKKALTKRNESDAKSVIFELVDKRNALERVMMHFAHFKKEAEKLDEIHYRVKVYYDKEDETELVIRVLSFGPMIKVVEPVHFVELIKQRLIQQKHAMNE